MGIFDGIFGGKKNNNSKKQFRFYSKDIDGLISYFKEREGMERIFNGLTSSIRKGITVKEI